MYDVARFDERDFSYQRPLPRGTGTNVGIFLILLLMVGGVLLVVLLPTLLLANAQPPLPSFTGNSTTAPP